MSATKMRVTFDLDCAYTLRVLREAGVPETDAGFARYVERVVGRALAGMDLPGLLHGDPTTGLPEVTVAPVED